MWCLGRGCRVMGRFSRGAAPDGHVRGCSCWVMGRFSQGTACNGKGWGRNRRATGRLSQDMAYSITWRTITVARSKSFSTYKQRWYQTIKVRYHLTTAARPTGRSGSLTTRVVRRLGSHDDVVRVGFAQTSVGDADETSPGASSQPARVPPSITEEAPATRALAMSPE